MLKVLLAAVVLLAFAGCSGGDGDDAALKTADTSGTQAHALTDAEMEALTRLQVPGFTSTEAGLTLLGAGMTYTSNATTSSGAQLQVVVRMAACDDFICQTLDPKTYEGAEEQRNLKSILPAAHIANPQLRWEFGKIEFSKKATGLSTYAVSYLEEGGVGGPVSRSSTNTYLAWWHNESIFVNVNIYPRGGEQTLSLADLNRRMTKDEAERALKDVFAVLEPELPKP